MPTVHESQVREQIGTRYPAAFAEPCKARSVRRLGDAVGVTQFGANLVRLPPGTWSSQRHWHTHEDELVYVVSGEVVLVTDAGEETLRAGHCAWFRGGVPDGHCFQNRSGADVVLFVVGSRIPEDGGDYPGLDMVFRGNRYAGQGGFFHRDGRPY
jgi:uncharacterized cupin superfamily protein